MQEKCTHGVNDSLNFHIISFHLFLRCEGSKFDSVQWFIRTIAFPSIYQWMICKPSPHFDFHFLSLESNLVPSVAPAVPFTPWEVYAVDKGAGGINRRPGCLQDHRHKIIAPWSLKALVCKWSKVSKMMHVSPCQAVVPDNDVTVLASRAAQPLLNGWTWGDAGADQ